MKHTQELSQAGLSASGGPWVANTPRSCGCVRDHIGGNGGGGQCLALCDEAHRLLRAIGTAYRAGDMAGYTAALGMYLRHREGRG